MVSGHGASDAMPWRCKDMVTHMHLTAAAMRAVWVHVLRHDTATRA